MALRSLGETLLNCKRYIFTVISPFYYVLLKKGVQGLIIRFGQEQTVYFPGSIELSQAVILVGFGVNYRNPALGCEKHARV